MSKRKKTMYEQIIEPVLLGKSVRATYYDSPSMVIRATRRLFGKRISRYGNVEIMLTIGKPNYSERQLMNSWKKRTGERSSALFGTIIFKEYRPRKNPIRK